VILAVLAELRLVIDGQTDGLTDRQCHNIMLRGKNVGLHKFTSYAINNGETSNHTMHIYSHSSTKFLLAPRYASAVYDMVLRLCVHVCVTSRSSIETAGWLELVFDAEATFRLSYTVLQGNSGIFKNKGTSLCDLVPNSEFSRFYGRRA